MKRIVMSVCALVCFGAVGVHGVAQDNPWNGSWKVDQSSMKYEGPTFNVAIDPDGFTVTRGGTASPKVICDGQPKMDKGVSVTCTKSDDGYGVAVTKDGKPINNVKLTMSADGKTMTRRVEIFPSQGSPFTITTTSERVGEGKGMKADWKEVSFKESQDTGILAIKVDGDSVAFKETDNDTAVVCKMDGTETSVGDGRTMSVKPDGPHTLKVTYKNGGKIARENTFVLSEDGSTVTETDKTPDPSPSTTSMMFHKS